MIWRPSSVRFVHMTHLSGPKNLHWVKYVINSLPSSGSGLSPFMLMCFQPPPLFSVQEQDAMVQSAHAAAHRCFKA